MKRSGLVAACCDNYGVASRWWALKSGRRCDGNDETCTFTTKSTSNKSLGRPWISRNESDGEGRRCPVYRPSSCDGIAISRVSRVRFFRGG